MTKITNPIKFKVIDVSSSGRFICERLSTLYPLTGRINNFGDLSYSEKIGTLEQRINSICNIYRRQLKEIDCISKYTNYFNQHANCLPAFAKVEISNNFNVTCHKFFCPNCYAKSIGNNFELIRDKFKNLPNRDQYKLVFIRSRKIIQARGRLYPAAYIKANSNTVNRLQKYIKIRTSSFGIMGRIDFEPIGDHYWNIYRSTVLLLSKNINIMDSNIIRPKTIKPRELTEYSSYEISKFTANCFRFPKEVLNKDLAEDIYNLLKVKKNKLSYRRGLFINK